MSAHTVNLMDRIHFEPMTGCWLYAGRYDADGYGRFQFKGKTVRAHRHAFEQHRGPVPDGMVLDHKCRVPACCNPDHLEPVTTQENTRRGKKVALIGDLCRNGHPRTAENTYTWGRHGWKACRICKTEEARTRRAKR